MGRSSSPFSLVIIFTCSDTFSTATRFFSSSATPRGASLSSFQAIRLCKTPVRKLVAEQVATTQQVPTFEPLFEAARIAATLATLPPMLTPVKTVSTSGNSAAAQEPIAAASSTPEQICTKKSDTEGIMWWNWSLGLRFP